MQLQTMPRKLTAEGAYFLAGRLLRLADGPTDTPATWHELARQLGIGVTTYHAAGAGRGEFIAPPPDGEPARIAINLAYPPEEVASAYIHEISEVLLRWMQPPLFPSEADCGRYEGDPDDILHRIARRVERVILHKHQ